jgi:hypothetical protein
MENISTKRTTPKWFKDKVIKLAPKIAAVVSSRICDLSACMKCCARLELLLWLSASTLPGAITECSNVINQIEDSAHTQTTKYITFWNIKRAFDSIPRNLQNLNVLLSLRMYRLCEPTKRGANTAISCDMAALRFLCLPWTDNTSSEKLLYHTGASLSKI